jgi:hypothetical protein
VTVRRSWNNRSVPVRILLALLCLSVVVGGAVRASTLGVRTKVPASGRERRSTAGCVTSKRLVCIGSKDVGRKFVVASGETVEVSLASSGLNWGAVQEIGPEALRQVGLSQSEANQFVVTFATQRSGSSMLQDTARPICVVGHACPQFVVLWRVQVVVQ